MKFASIVTAAGLTLVLVGAAARGEPVAGPSPAGGFDVRPNFRVIDSVAELRRCFAVHSGPAWHSRDASPRAGEDARAWEENQRMLRAARRRKWLGAALPWMLCAVLAAAGVWLLLRG